MSGWELTRGGTIKVHSESNVVNALRKLGCVVRRNWTEGCFYTQFKGDAHLIREPYRPTRIRNLIHSEFGFRPGFAAIRRALFAEVGR